MIKRSVLRLLTNLLICVIWLSGGTTTVTAMGLQITDVTSPELDVTLSLEELDALAQTEFSTTTIWTDGVDTFSGVSLKTLLSHLNATGKTIEMIALNDYAVSMPMAELDGDAPIIATRMNGQSMSVRDKGPYWVIYPYDSDPSYRTETVYARSIWQLNRLKVID